MRDPSRCLDGIQQIRPQDLRSPLEIYANGCKRHSASRSLKERVTEHRLHLLDLLTQHWLGDAKLRCRATEVLSLRNSEEVAKIAHLEFSSSHI